MRQVGPPPKIRVPPNIFDQLKEKSSPSQSSYPRFQGSNASNERLYESQPNITTQSDRNMSPSVTDNYNSQISDRLLSYTAAQPDIRKAFDDDVEREMRLLEANMKQLVSNTKDEIPSSTNRYASYEQPSSNRHESHEPSSSSRYENYEQASSRYEPSLANRYEPPLANRYEPQSANRYDSYEVPLASQYESYEPSSHRQSNYEQPKYNESKQYQSRYEYQDQPSSNSYVESNKRSQHQQDRGFNPSPSEVMTGGVVRRKGSGILNLYKSPTDGRDEKTLQQMKYAQQLKQQVDEKNQLGETNNASRQRKGDIIDISYSDGYDNSKFPPPSADILRDMYGINPSKLSSSPANGMLFGLDKDSERNLKRAKQDEYRRQLDSESRKISESSLKNSPSYSNQPIPVQHQDIATDVYTERKFQPTEKDIKRAKQEEYRRQLDFESAESKRLQKEQDLVRNISYTKSPPVVVEPDNQSGLMIGAMKIDPNEALITRRYGQNEYADLLKQDSRYNKQETPNRLPPSYPSYPAYDNYTGQAETLPSSSEKSNYVPDAMAVLRDEKALEMAKRRQQQEEYRSLLDQQVKNKASPIESKNIPTGNPNAHIATRDDQQVASDLKYSDFNQQQYPNQTEQSSYREYGEYQYGDNHYTHNDSYQQSYLQSYPPKPQGIAGSYDQPHQQVNDFQQTINTQVSQLPDESGKTPIKTLARNRLINDVYGSKGIVLEVSPEMQADWRPSKKVVDDRTKAAQLEQKAALEKQIAEDRKRKEDEALEIKIREEREEEKVRAELAALSQKEIRNKELKKAQEYEQIMATKALQDKMAQDALARKNKHRNTDSPYSPQRSGQGENARVIHTPPFKGSPNRFSVINSPPRVITAPPHRRENENHTNASLQHLQRDTSRGEFHPQQWHNTMNSSSSHQIPENQYMNSYRQELQRPGTAEINKYLSDWQRNSQDRLDNMIHDRNNIQRYGLGNQSRNHYQDYQEEDISFVSESRLVSANPYDHSGLISALRPLGSSMERINFQNDDTNTSFSRNSLKHNYRDTEDMVEKSLNADSFLIYLDKNKATPLKSSSPFGTDIAITESFVASSRNRPPSGKPVPKESLLEKLSYSDEKDRAITGHHNTRTPGGRPFNRIDDDDYTEDESDEIIVVSQTSPAKKVLSTPPRSNNEIRSRPLSSMSPGEFRRSNSGSKILSGGKSNQKEESFIVMSPTKEERMAMLETSLKSPLASPQKIIKPSDSVYQSAAMQEFMNSHSKLNTATENPSSSQRLNEDSKWRVSSKDKVDTILQLQKRSSANDNLLNTVDGYGDSFEEEDDDDDELIRKYLKKEQIDFNTTMDSKIDNYEYNDSFIDEDKVLTTI